MQVLPLKFVYLLTMESRDQWHLFSRNDSRIAWSKKRRLEQKKKKKIPL